MCERKAQKKGRPLVPEEEEQEEKLGKISLNTRGFDETGGAKLEGLLGLSGEGDRVSEVSEAKIL